MAPEQIGEERVEIEGLARAPRPEPVAGGDRPGDRIVELGVEDRPGDERAPDESRVVGEPQEARDEAREEDRMGAQDGERVPVRVRRVRRARRGQRRMALTVPHVVWSTASGPQVERLVITMPQRLSRPWTARSSQSPWLPERFT